MSDQTPDPAEQQTAAEEAAAAQVPADTSEATPAIGAEEQAAAAAPDGAPTADAAAEPADEALATDGEQKPAGEAEPDASEDADLEDDEPETPRVKPAIPGMDLEVDIVLEGDGDGDADADADAESSDEDHDVHAEPIAASIVLAEGARYRATGKRKTAVARVVLKPGTGIYLINGKTLDVFFPRPTLQRNIRQPLEAVAFDTRMDVDVRLHGGGVSSQAGALRHGISRALLEADPNLRGELKRRGFLTRDSRVKERKKAGLKKARKKPQFSKR